jgi:uncharacterized protein YecE (DUF72 family)
MKRIYIGTSGWSYKDWVGNFYPRDIKVKDYLTLYSQHFNAVEIDSSFYGIPRKTSVENWYKMVPSTFKFSPKFPQDITHNSDLTSVEETLKAFLDTMAILKEKLGPLLLQFPYSFKPEMFSNLARFLKLLPNDFNFVVEIRNRKWLTEKFYDLLRKEGIGLALLEHPWMPKIETVTSKILYARFIGDRRKIEDDFSHVQIDREKNLDEWKRIVLALEEKVDDFYGYFNNHYSGHAPTTADYFKDIITAHQKPLSVKSGK